MEERKCRHKIRILLCLLSLALLLCRVVNMTGVGKYYTKDREIDNCTYAIVKVLLSPLSPINTGEREVGE
jgi:hypothetical protein